jgi:hypothetical protein
MNKILTIASLLFTVSLLITAAQADPALNIKLTLNNTQNTIYIPGIGETTPSAGTGTYTSPPHYYLASYRTNNMKALVFSQQIPISLQVSYNSSHHFLTLNQNITNSQTLLSFTRGGYKEIDNRISLVEEGSFFSKISPSFSHTLGSINPIKIVLNYTNIDIQNTLILRRGVHEIAFESNKTNNNNIILVSEMI